MVKTTLSIDGMSCEMCEAHMNDAVRKAFSVKKVTSSHKKRETIIISESNLEESKIKEAIEPTGYKVLSVKSEPYEKKSLLSRIFK